MDPEILLADLRARKTPALARAISIVENGRPGFEALLAAIHPLLGTARRIGLTGPPGAGKSTLTEGLVQAYRSQGLSVAVVAVDPTSPFTGGALLGDRIRMESVALDSGVYIRSMATRGSLGGLATTTREVCDILDAGGFDRIIIETVGVGQSELDVARMADSTVLILVPESGDGIQTLKSGVMEIADIFVVNKSDRPGADRLRQEIEVMLGFRSGNAFRNVRAHHGARAVEAEGAVVAGNKNAKRSGVSSTPIPAAPAAPAPSASSWRPSVLATVASKGEGIHELVVALEAHHEWLRKSGALVDRRRRRLMERTREVVDRATRHWVWQETQTDQVIQARLAELESGTTSPYELAAEIVEGLKQGVRL